MLNFKKVILIRIISCVVIAVFVFDGYAYPLSLRVPAGGLGIERAWEAADEIAATAEGLPGKGAFLSEIYEIGAKEYQSKIMPCGDSYLANALQLIQELKQLAPKTSDFITASVFLSMIRSERLAVLLKSGKIKREIRDNIVKTVERLNKITGLVYLPPEKGSDIIQNQMEAIAQLAETSDIMLAVFALKLQAIDTVNNEAGRKYLYREITEIYAPLAERLGLDGLSGRFRDESFKLAHPVEYEETKIKMENILGMSYYDAQLYLNDYEEWIFEELAKKGIKARVESRLKGIYSVYEKTRAKNVSEKDLTDLFGVRMIFNSEEDLWNGFSAINMSNKIFDKKSPMKRVEKSGYEAFQISARDIKGRPCEYQFITEENYRRYKYGMAAHWAYKLERQTGQSFYMEDFYLTDDFQENFNFLYNSVKDMVFVFEEEFEKSGKRIFKPVKLKKQSTPPDFAAACQVDMFDKNYSGAISFTAMYDNDHDNIVFSPEIRRSPKYILKTGDIIKVLIKKDEMLKSDSLRKTIKDSSEELRTRLLVDNLEEKKMREVVKKGRNAAAKAGFSSKDENFLFFIASRFGLKNVDELCAFICSGMGISIEDLKAYDRGRKILENKRIFFMTDNVALRRIISIRKEFPLVDSFLDFLRAMGDGRIKEKELEGKLFRKDIALSLDSEGISEAGTSKYRLMLTCEDRRGLLAQVSVILENLDIKSRDVAVKNINSRKVKLSISLEIYDYNKIGKLIETLQARLVNANNFSAITTLKFLEKEGRKERIRILTKDRTGIIGEITSVLADHGVNIIGFHPLYGRARGEEIGYEAIVVIPPTIENKSIQSALERINEVAVSFKAYDLEKGERSNFQRLNEIRRGLLRAPVGNIAAGRINYLYQGVALLKETDAFISTDFYRNGDFKERSRPLREYLLQMGKEDAAGSTIKIRQFPDGEFQNIIFDPDEARGKNCLIINRIEREEDMIELLLSIALLRNSGAKKISCVLSENFKGEGNILEIISNFAEIYFLPGHYFASMRRDFSGLKLEKHVPKKKIPKDMRRLFLIKLSKIMQAPEMVLFTEDYAVLKKTIAEGLVADKGIKIGYADVRTSIPSEIKIPAVFGRKVTLIHSTKTAKGLVEFLLLLSELNKKGARSISCIVPYFGYARGDKNHPVPKFGKKAISENAVELLLYIIREYAEELDTVNVHFLKQPGDNIFPGLEGFNINNLNAFSLLAKHYRDRYGLYNCEKPGPRQNVPVLIAPDGGSLAFVKETAEKFGWDYGYFEKTRDPDSGEVVMIPMYMFKNSSEERLSLSDNIEDRDVITLDDIIAKGTTTVAAASLLKKYGARRVFSGCIHGIFSEGMKPFMDAEVEVIKDGEKGKVKVYESIEHIVSTDSVISERSVVSLADLFIEYLKERKRLSFYYLNEIGCGL